MRMKSLKRFLRTPTSWGGVFLGVGGTCFCLSWKQYIPSFFFRVSYGLMGCGAVCFQVRFTQYVLKRIENAKCEEIMQQIVDEEEILREACSRFMYMRETMEGPLLVEEKKDILKALLRKTMEGASTCATCATRGSPVGTVSTFDGTTQVTEAGSLASPDGRDSTPTPVNGAKTENSQQGFMPEAVGSEDDESSRARKVKQQKEAEEINQILIEEISQLATEPTIHTLFREISAEVLEERKQEAKKNLPEEERKEAGEGETKQSVKGVHSGPIKAAVTEELVGEEVSHDIRKNEARDILADDAILRILDEGNRGEQHQQNLLENLQPNPAVEHEAIEQEQENPGRIPVEEPQGDEAGNIQLQIAEAVAEMHGDEA